MRPSLRALALRLVEGKAPIGQHSLSVMANGELPLFNNGLGSLTQPPGAPPGATRTFRTPSRYAIDEKAGNYLAAYSVRDSRTGARLLGVDSHGKVSFDFAYPADVGKTVFIAQPLGWTDLRLR